MSSNTYLDAFESFRKTTLELYGEDAESVISWLQSADSESILLPDLGAHQSGVSLALVESILNEGVALGLLHQETQFYCSCMLPVESAHATCGTGCEVDDIRRTSSKIWRLASQFEVRHYLKREFNTLVLTAIKTEAAAVNRQLGLTETVAIAGKIFDCGIFHGTHCSSSILHASLLGDYANNAAAAMVASLLTAHPTINLVLIVGIAGSCPNRSDAEKHPRLGDVVFSGNMGTVQYDIGKQFDNSFEIRSPPRAPSSRALHTAKRILRSQLKSLSSGIAAPGKHEGVNDSPPGTRGRAWAHPRRTGAGPHVFEGVIGCGNSVLKSPTVRDQLHNMGVLAVEMESAGASHAAWSLDREYFTIRAISDYCNERKANGWQAYAAEIAAMFAKLLLDSIAPARTL